MQAPRTVTMAIPVLSSQTTDQKLAALDARLTALENLLKLQKDGSATLKASKLVLEAISIEVRSMQSTSIRAGSDLMLRASSVSLRGDGMVDMQAGATATLKASLLKLNDAGKPVARVGDLVSPAGVIVNGSPTILA